MLVVGPSGVGKDTLIGGARHALANDKRFSFVRRIVTRPAAIDVEDHDSMDLHSFRESEAAGRFALAWDAHDLRYALPISLDTDLALGRVVVANVSRHVVGDACSKYPSCAVILITAEISCRAERLRQRGRESAAVPAGIEPIIIDNSGSLAIGVTAFVMALRAIVAQD